ncbi:MAG: hypothetical protein KY467_07835 [Gemmatimonadetes bacterium]|nr:hypothetical protein [Gemmatimonadota bacterium]
MIRLLRTLLVALASAFALLALGAATRNYVRAETRGTVPVERLARRGSDLERQVARAVADSLATGRYTRGQEWYARRERSANGDTIRFRIYRAEDARLPGRILRPDPWVIGGAVYVISERKLVGPAIGVS